MSESVNFTLLNKVKTTSEWEAITVKPPKGEICFAETGTGYGNYYPKIGNGTATFANLPVAGIYGQGIEIGQGKQISITDLNDLVYPGSYYASSEAFGQLANKPVGHQLTGRVIIKVFSNDTEKNLYTQLLFSSSGRSVFYMRNLYKANDTWTYSEWISYFGLISNTVSEENTQIANSEVVQIPIRVPYTGYYQLFVQVIFRGTSQNGYTGIGEGTRRIKIDGNDSFNTGDSAWGPGYTGCPTTLYMMRNLDITAEDGTYIKIFQNSGSSIYVDVMYTYTRLGDKD